MRWSQGWRFDPHLLLSACWNVLGQDTEPQIAPNGQASVVAHCLIAICEGVRDWVKNLQSALDKSAI